MKKTTSILAAMLMVINIIQAQWVELGLPDHTLGAGNVIYSVVADASGNVYAAGQFGDTSTRTFYVSEWSGDTAWARVGRATGTDSFKANGYIYSLATDPSGNLYAAGAFTDGPTQSSGHIYVAKWNGSGWSKLGTNGVATVPNTSGSAIYSIALDASGNIYAGGIFKNTSGKYYVSKWNGTLWAELGTGSASLNANSYIHNVVTDIHGNVYATGNFTDAAGMKYVAKWDGSSWSEMGAGISSSPVNALTTDLNGNVYVAYADSIANYFVAKWDGTNWVKVDGLDANNSINVITTDAQGNLYAAGNFADGNAEKYVAKYDGTWQELGTGTNSLDPNGYILTLATDASLNVYAAGYFTGFNGHYIVSKYDPNNQGPNSIGNISSSDADLSVEPNPSSGIASIRMVSALQSDLSVGLYDMTGRLIRELYNSERQTGETKIAFDASDIATGIYTIRVYNGQSISQKRFVKM